MIHSFFLPGLTATEGAPLFVVFEGWEPRAHTAKGLAWELRYVPQRAQALWKGLALAVPLASGKIVGF